MTASGYFVAIGGTGAALLEIQSFAFADFDGLAQVNASAFTSFGGGTGVSFIPIIFGQPWLETASATVGISGSCQSGTICNLDGGYRQVSTGSNTIAILDTNFQPIAGASIVGVPEPTTILLIVIGL